MVDLEELINRDYLVIFRENLGDKPLSTETKPKPNEDITEMQMEDVREKLAKLQDEVQNFPKSESNEDREITYRRLSESCVKYSIALDRVNVIGREKVRNERKEMLMKIDGLSTQIVDKYEQKRAPEN
ncbi:unnamed protein product [Allacma fusca]|uniref:BAG domain-containing protein n=1 Tax=Allacma fusca TaxID=39272 RepID=A0A8J2PDI5_9HEXA|nr:unnamed protein product [Allacma fusca]